MSEAKFTAQITRELRALGAVVIVNYQTSKSTLGTPDRLIIHWNWTGYVELKDEKTPVAPHQRQLMNDIRKRNKRFCYVVRRRKMNDSFYITIETPNEKIIAKCECDGQDLLRTLEHL